MPLVSAGSTPGHLPTEHLDPLLSSFQSSANGTLCGNVSADSLAHVPVPTALLSGGSIACVEGYTAANSYLDVLVGGCRVLGGLVTVITKTQPDQEDPAAAPAGAGPPYTLVAGAAHVVTSCHDVSAAVVPLAACLKDAAYSSYFTFGAGRVIPK